MLSEFRDNNKENILEMVKLTAVQTQQLLLMGKISNIYQLKANGAREEFQ